MAEGITSMSIHNYARKYLKSYPELVDLLSPEIEEVAPDNSR